MNSKEISFKVMTGQELYDFLVDYNQEDPWAKIDEVQTNIKYFGNDFIPNRDTTKFIFFVAFHKKEIVGVLKLKTGGENSFEYPVSEWLSYISVHKDYSRKGISKKLIEMLFVYLSKNSFNQLIVSGYTKEGLEYTRNYIHNKANEYNIEIFDKNKIEF